MAEEFVYGHDAAGGWRQVQGPGYLNLQAVVATLGLLDIDPRLGYVGHHHGGFPDWRVFAKVPGGREIRGLLFEDLEYGRLDYDPYRAAAELLGLEFAGRAVRDGVPRHPAVTAPVPVNDPGYLPVAYGLFRGGDKAARKKAYWSVLPSTGGATWSPLSWFMSRSEGAVPVTDLEQLFPPVRVAAAEPVAPLPPADPSEGLAAIVARLEDAVREAVDGLTRRLDDLTARVGALDDGQRAGTTRVEVVEAHYAAVGLELAGLREAFRRPAPPPPESPPGPDEPGTHVGASVRVPAARTDAPAAGARPPARTGVLGIIVLLEATLCVIILAAMLGLTLIRSGYLIL